MVGLVALSKRFTKGKETIAIFDHLDLAIPRGDFHRRHGTVRIGQRPRCSISWAASTGPDEGEVPCGG